MYVNGKMRPVETVPGMGRGGKIKKNGEGVNSIMIYLIHLKNICKCHNVPLPSTTKKEKRKRKTFSQTNFTLNNKRHVYLPNNLFIYLGQMFFRDLQLKQMTFLKLNFFFNSS
jgi:hypothetical protein